MRPPVIAAILAVLALLMLWRPWTSNGGGSVPPSSGPVAPAVPDAAEASPPPSSATPPAGPRVDAQRSPLADPLNAADRTIADDLETLQELFGHYRSVFRLNPTGSNREITNALTGSNPQIYAPLPRDHPAINGQGELVDRWSTPFFFHNLSGEFIEVRSAGPDRKFWTGDDSVLSNAPAPPSP